MSRWIALGLLVLLATLQLKLWVSGGMRDVWRLQQEVLVQTHRAEERKQRNDVLTAEVLDLKTGQEAIEERARAELGMVGSGETFYQLIEAPTAATAQSAEVAQNLK